VLKVSVVVPVFDPGPDIDDCIRSLLDQSLPREHYEVVFVDDGSTDGTPERLDALAAEHPHVRVEHIPNSGWPGRPRNVGIERARGEYVLFVDNDDFIGPEALERMHATATRTDSDVVVGKVVGHGKSVPRVLFRQNRDRVTLDWGPLLGLLSPHKLFRRALLEEHAIRFPEGRRRLEDHAFVLHAYFHARNISVLADYPCYHWVLRREGEPTEEDEGEIVNASLRPFEPAAYFQNVRELLDLVDAHTEPGELRDRLRAYYYRGKMLGRVGGRKFLRRDPDYRRELYEEVRRLALERFGPEVDAALAFNLRIRSQLLREGRYEALEALAAVEPSLTADVEVTDVRRVDGNAEVSYRARLHGLRFRRDGERVLWVPPAGMQVPEEALDATADLERATARMILRGRFGGASYLLPGKARVELDDDGTPVLHGSARIEPRKVAAGSAVPPGRWEARTEVKVVGFQATEWAWRGRRRRPFVVVVTPRGEVAGPARQLVAAGARRLRRWRRLGAPPEPVRR
jgi:glycosyltransferase involved in cell wall biosynthesis